MRHPWLVSIAVIASFAQSKVRNRCRGFTRRKSTARYTPAVQPLLRASVLLLALASACSSNNAHDAAVDSLADAFDVAEDVAPTITTVTVFDGTQLSFTSTENHRTVDGSASFPDGPFQSVVLHLALECPSNRCDVWDRLGSLRIATGPAPADGGPPPFVEFARFVTTYGVRGNWDLDVTDLQPLFHGTQPVQAFIDTWVGPGSQYGNGWLLTATLEFTSGRPARTPVAAIPMAWDQAVYGDPARPIAMQLTPQMVNVPATGVTSSAMYVITTGHGQGNTQNCAEFCPRTHTLTVDGMDHPQDIWRDDCDQNPISNQRGNWQPSRAGWCPGDVVRPWITDLGTTLTPGAMHTIGYDVESYVNACRPDAMPCSACTLGAMCAYDGGAHTEPYYKVTAFLVLYGD